MVENWVKLIAWHENQDLKHGISHWLNNREIHRWSKPIQKKESEIFNLSISQSLVSIYYKETGVLA